MSFLVSGMGTTIVLSVLYKNVLHGFLLDIISEILQTPIKAFPLCMYIFRDLKCVIFKRDFTAHVKI